ncbi:MAG: phosphate-starvation-inducible PsiE family protein [Synechococcales bacterium]|nr:phosphate-starvation-inducible PsiE family protein [Synechococcales bacterium]
MRKVWRWLLSNWKDDVFLHRLHQLENIVSKLLAIGVLFVIVSAVAELAVYMFSYLRIPPLSGDGSASAVAFTKTLFTVFGLFLNVLIAFEIMENVTAYLKRNVIQVELVIATSLIAVARKIIILDLEKTQGLDLLALAGTIVALSAAYCVVHLCTPREP